MLQMVLERQAQREQQKKEDEIKEAEAAEFKLKSEQLVNEANATCDRFDELKSDISSNCDKAAYEVMMGLIQQQKMTPA